MAIEAHTSDGVAEVVIDYPPVNALPVQGWFDLADKISGAGKDPGVTFEEVQAATGFPLLRVDNLGATPGPTDEQLAIIRHLDPHNIRASILKDNPPGIRPAA